MIDAGIHSGDIAVVERGTGASKGDFVVAIVDNEFTLKELGMERGRFILIPHNPAYSPIDGTHAEIMGKVVTVLRKI
jgi:repressor LexA